MKEVQDPQAIKLTDYKNKPLTGYYIGKRKIESSKMESGESFIHLFQEKDGTEVEIWSFEMLKRKLSKVPIGSLVKMVYTGTIPMEGTDKTVHQVNVFYDEKDKININE